MCIEKTHWKIREFIENLQTTIITDALSEKCRNKRLTPTLWREQTCCGKNWPPNFMGSLKRATSTTWSTYLVFHVFPFSPRNRMGKRIKFEILMSRSTLVLRSPSFIPQFPWRIDRARRESEEEWDEKRQTLVRTTSSNGARLNRPGRLL